MFVMNSFARFLKWVKGTKPSCSVSAFSTSHHLSIKPGQILGSRFTIVKQLGAGQHSTVWLATSCDMHSRCCFENLILLLRDNGPKAIKILTSDVTSLQGKDAFELEVLERISTTQSSLTNKRLLQLQDHFRITGEHGEHLCLVTEPLGPSLSDVQSTMESKCLPLPLVKHVTRQLLEGLQVLHDQCHTVHTGDIYSNPFFQAFLTLSVDIKPDNILFTKATAMWGTVNVNPATFDSVDIMLVDFGTGELRRKVLALVALKIPSYATRCSTYPPDPTSSPSLSRGNNRLRMELQSRHLEPWLYCKHLYSSLLSFMYRPFQVFELITGQHLFKPKADAAWSAEQYHLARIFATFGTSDVPQNILNFFRQGQHFEKYFNNEGT